MKKCLTCIECPVGCLLEINYDEKNLRSKDIVVSGNQCKKGKSFALKEIKDPRRVLTTTIGINSKTYSRLPVRSEKTVPKKEILRMITKVKKIQAEAPINMGDPIYKNLMGTGVDIVSSTTIKE